MAWGCAIAGPYPSWPCRTANCQLRLSVLYGTMQVHYVDTLEGLLLGASQNWVPWLVLQVLKDFKGSNCRQKASPTLSEHPDGQCHQRT